MTRHDKWVDATQKAKTVFNSTEGDENTKYEAARKAFNDALDESGATREELRTMVFVFTTGQRPQEDMDTVDTL